MILRFLSSLACLENHPADRSCNVFVNIFHISMMIDSFVQSRSCPPARFRGDNVEKKIPPRELHVHKTGSVFLSSEKLRNYVITALLFFFVFFAISSPFIPIFFKLKSENVTPHIHWRNYSATPPIFIDYCLDEVFL